MSLGVLSLYKILEAKGRDHLWREDSVVGWEALLLAFDESQHFMPGRTRTRDEED